VVTLHRGFATLGLALGLWHEDPRASGGGSPPVNTVAPVVTGTGYVGFTLTTTDGTWTGSPTFAYQWQRSGVDIGGATSSTYVVTLADEGVPVRCVVTATNGDGSASANSNAIEQWVPSDLTGLGMWLDALSPSTVILNGSTVAEWQDRSGNGLHLTQETAANQPIYDAAGFNSRPNLRNVSNDFLTRADVPTFRAVSGATIVLAGQVAAVSYGSNASPVFFSSGTTNSSTRFAINWAANTSLNIGVAARRLDADTFTPRPSSTSRASVQGAPMVEVGEMDYSSAMATHWTNGTQDLNEATLTTGVTSNTDSLIVGVFAGGPSVVPVANGTIVAEVIAAGRALTDGEREQVEGYIAHRWGFAASLPGGHPYAGAAP
jgi:hypothetical protein